MAELDSKLIGIGDLEQIRQIGSVAVSPDGGWVAYGVTSIVEDDGEGGEGGLTYRSQIWLAALDGSSPPRQLTFGEAGASSPVWHPDGEQLAFVRGTDDGPQVFVLPLAGGGEAQQLTSVEGGVYGPRYSPDGTQLAFGHELSWAEVARQAKDAGETAHPAWPDERPGREMGDVANWGDEELSDDDKPAADPDGDLAAVREFLAKNAADANPRVFNRLDFHGERDLDPGWSFSHLYSLALGSDDDEKKAEPVALTRGFAFYGLPVWMPDGAALVTAGWAKASPHPDRDLDADLFRVPADGSGPELLLDLPGWSIFNPRPSPDGRWVAFQAVSHENRGYAPVRLGIVPATGGEGQLLTLDFDRSVQDPHFSADGRFLYFTAASNGGYPLYRLGLAADGTAAGEVEQLTGYDAGLRDFDLGPTGLAYVLTTAANPYELYAGALDGSAPRALSRHNAAWLEGKELATMERRQLRRPDGFEVDYWIMKPTRFEAGKRYPLLLEMHGGPSAMWGPGEETMWHEFQVMAARGFAIVFANPRGSGGYGFDFQHANYQNWGDGPAGDVLAAASEAAQLPWVDPDHQVVTGGSYAGYLTAWIVGHDHRFDAAVAQRGVYSLGTFLGEANAWRLVPWHHGGYPWQEEAAAVLHRESPLTYVEEIDTPLLLIHADQDLRAGVIGSELFYKYLKILEKDVEYVRYPGEGHELSRSGNPERRMDRLARIFEFFSRYVEPGGTAASP